MTRPLRWRTLWQRWRPHVVVAVFLFHALGSCVLGIPDPRVGLDRRAWKDPRAARELEAWARTFHTDRVQLEDRLFRLGMFGASVRDAVTLPFAPYHRLAGIRQRFTMFSAGTPYADAFELRGQRADGSLVQLYHRDDPDAEVLRSVIEAPRMRSYENSASWNNRAARRRTLCAALAVQALSSADLQALECSFVRTTVADPRGRKPPGDAQRERAVWVTREDLSAGGQP